LKWQKSPRLKPLNIFKRNGGKFQEELSTSSIPINQSVNVDELNDEILKSLVNAAKIAIPVVSILNQRVSNLPDEILEINSLKNRLYRK